jgi:hypothetical protein
MPVPDFKILIQPLEDDLFVYVYHPHLTPAAHHHQKPHHTVGWKCTPFGPDRRFTIKFPSVADSPFSWTEQTIDSSGPWQAWAIKDDVEIGRVYKYRVIVGDLEDDPDIQIDPIVFPDGLLSAALIGAGVALIGFGMSRLLTGRRRLPPT